MQPFEALRRPALSNGRRQARSATAFVMLYSASVVLFTGAMSVFGG